MLTPGADAERTDAHPIAVGSPAWQEWLVRDDITRFQFEDGAGCFTAQRRRRHGRWHWYATCQHGGRRHMIVLGTTDDLTLERLQQAAVALEHRDDRADTPRIAPPAGQARGNAYDLETTTLGISHAEPGPLADDVALQAAEASASDIVSLPALPLLATKLFLPRPRSDLLVRPHLLARLEVGVHGPLTVLIAPAGWGKTSLLSAYCAAPAHDTGEGALAVAWVSLDAGDNDPIRFWTYVLAALNTACAGVGEAALAQLRLAQPLPIELVLTHLLNGLAAQQADIILVLDDYHVITAESVHAAITFLLNHLPSRCHLVLSSREDPPFPLSRWRAQAAVTELRAADLRFTPEETAAFLTAALGVDVALSMEGIRALDARSEGWIAGLQLAALSLRGQSRQQAAAFIAAFAGSNRYIVDYLVEEVLARQPPAIQTFLLRTAVVDRFCAPLCEELMADPDWASGDASPTIHALLERAERANLFLIPLDDERHWYRYHHLFADVLRSRLRQQDPALAAALHQRASRWFEGQGLVVEAIQQALAASEVERVAELVEQHGLGLG